MRPIRHAPTAAHERIVLGIVRVDRRHTRGAALRREPQRLPAAARPNVCVPARSLRDLPPCTSGADSYTLDTVERAGRTKPSSRHGHATAAWASEVRRCASAMVRRSDKRTTRHSWYAQRMRPVLANLVELLSLETIDRDLFRGRSQDLGWGAIFGGQVLGQALSAAVQTVVSDRHVHSLHGYFIRAGDVTRPIIYQVARLRDGKSFSVRQVTAMQQGEAIFTLASSFQVEEQGFEHQDEMPNVAAPETLRSALERDLALSVADRLS